MKLEFRIEDGKPLIVFPEDIYHDKSVGVYCAENGHCGASRACLRGLKKPQTEEELRLCWLALANYIAGHCLR